VSKAKIVIHAEKCCGCRICELICSLTHTGVFNLSKARIRVCIQRTPSNKKISPFLIDVPVVCEECNPAPCMEICPVEAFSRDPQTDAVLIDEDECTGCGLCIEECPEGILRLDLDRNIAIKCDLCSGSPECVKYCPTSALDFKI